MGHIVRGLIHRCRSATRDNAQWMESGLPGPAGVPVLYPVEEAPGRGQRTAQTQPLSLEGTNVKEMTYRLTSATVTPAPFMATGVHGVVGELAAEHAMEAR